ncbi:MAG: FecCD family ABC transporter permease [Gemmatimonadota bacterium]
MSRTRGQVLPGKSGAAWLLGLVLLAGSSGVLLGPAGFSPAELWRALMPGAEPSTARSILLSLRLPRTVGALATGASLAVSGALFQALLRNPLAEPYLLGVSSGAALGAVAAITLGLGSLGPAFLTLASLAGAILAVGVVFRVASVVGKLDTRVLILAGVVVASFFGACVMLLLTFAEGEALRSAVLWTMGSLAGASWGTDLALLAYALPASAIAFGMSRDLNALALGEEAAAHLGTDVERAKRRAYFLASALAAAAVAVAGVVGFVGLVVPHTVRLLWGADHRLVLPLSFLGGAALLGLADTAARTVASPLEVPIGVITALVGVPFFLFLLRRSSV